MRVRVGTSGFSYKEWKGSFYPQRLPNAKMLRFYGERFDTVEINNTFYRMPNPGVLEGWLSEVGEDFSFVLKASQRITHHKKKIEEVAATTKEFFDTAKTMGVRLGPVLVQLPPYLEKDLPRLTAFFDLVPKDMRVALEVGSPTWFEDDFYALLRERGASLCIVDDPKKRTPFVATTSWGYLRLRETAYKKAALAAWADKVTSQAWNEAYVFFKHEDEGTGPRLGAAFKKLLSSRAPRPESSVVETVK